MTIRPATAAEVRKSIKDQGHTVRINRDGQVAFRRNGEGSWLEGCNVSQYVTEADGEVHLR